MIRAEEAETRVKAPLRDGSANSRLTRSNSSRRTTTPPLTSRSGSPVDFWLKPVTLMHGPSGAVLVLLAVNVMATTIPHSPIGIIAASMCRPLLAGGNRRVPASSSYISPSLTADLVSRRHKLW